MCFTFMEAGLGVRGDPLPYQAIDATTLEIPHHRQTAWENSPAFFVQRDMEIFDPVDGEIYAHNDPAPGSRNIRREPPDHSVASSQADTPIKKVNSRD